ncbi:MAG: CBS domain-containing protein [Solirubrobacterales bacterium]
MPDRITTANLREIRPLRPDDALGTAARRVLESELPALPVVSAEGKYLGVFGEREFIEAVFPAYVGSLHSARMVRAAFNETIAWRWGCIEKPVSEYLTEDKIVVEDGFSDLQLAETFLHHRVLIVPIERNGKVDAVVTREDFFRGLAEQASGHLEDFGE